MERKSRSLFLKHEVGVSIRHPSGAVKQAVGYMSMEFREDVLAGDIK